MIRITGITDQTIMNETIRLSKKSRKIKPVMESNDVRNSFYHRKDNQVNCNLNQPSNFPIILAQELEKIKSKQLK